MDHTQVPGTPPDATPTAVLDADVAALDGVASAQAAPRRRVRLTPEDYPKSQRHARQAVGRSPHVGAVAPPQPLANLEIAPIAGIGDLAHLAEAPTFTLDERCKRFKITVEPADDSAPSPFVYLFNVIVAMEWLPTQETLLPIMRGLRAASDCLYDATNGCMAFGQVVFGGPELMAQADIQILASNRFHPRSMVNGLNVESKYAPIRLGRGSWHKNNRILMPWDESIAYRAITHEWAHYALSLLDEYIDEMRRVVRRGDRLFTSDQSALTLVVPKVQLPIESLMATLDSSELVPHQHAAHLSEELQSRLLNKIEQWYPGVSAQIMQPLSGPQRFPAGLPQFYTLDGFKINDPSAEEVQIDADNIELEHCWLYTLDWGEQQTVRLTAQGSLDGRARSFQIAPGGPLIPGAGTTLLGARPESTLLAVGTAAHGLVIQRASLQPGEQVVSWAGCAPASPPVIAVLPEPDATDWQSPLKVRLHLADGTQPDLAWILEPGGLPAKPYYFTRAGEIEYAPEATGGFQQISQLDGTVLLTWRDGGDDQHWVAEYSHGGNPPTSVRSAGAPISAGSADGNLLIFSRTENSQRGDRDYDVRIVTTRNFAGFEEGRPGEPRSYLFSVASNMPLDYAHYRPTMVLYYDAEALDDDLDLQIYRYDTYLKEWGPVPTYLPGGSFYAAAALDAISAPHLIAQYPPGGVRVEYYRLFAVHRAGRLT